MPTPEQETLLEFPCAFPLKIMGLADPTLAQRVLEVVLRHAPDFDGASMEMRASSGGKYVSLTQSNADEDKLVAFIHSDVYPGGTEDVGGTRWVVYDGGARGEPVWTTRLDGPDGTQIALTGAAGPAEFRTLAAAVRNAPPLPAGRT